MRAHYAGSLEVPHPWPAAHRAFRGRNRLNDALRLVFMRSVVVLVALLAASLPACDDDEEPGEVISDAAVETSPPGPDAGGLDQPTDQVDGPLPLDVASDVPGDLPAVEDGPAAERKPHPSCRKPDNENPPDAAYGTIFYDVESPEDGRPFGLTQVNSGNAAHVCAGELGQEGELEVCTPEGRGRAVVSGLNLFWVKFRVDPIPLGETQIHCKGTTLRVRRTR
jgi:hypothetical protein